MTGGANQVLILMLPFPPSVNTYWRSPRKGPLAGRTLISERGRKYRTDALASIFGVRRKFYDCRLQVEIELCPPDKRRRDLDNYLKAVLDAITHSGVWADDEQVDQLLIRRGDVVKGGVCIVTIKERESVGDISGMGVAEGGPTLSDRDLEATERDTVLPADMASRRAG